MKVLVHWILAQRQRLIVVAIVAAPLFAVVTAGLVALDTLRNGVGRSVSAAGLIVAGISLLAWISRGDVYAFALIGLMAALSGIAAGGVARWAGNLVLAFQGVLLLSLAFVLVFGALGPDPELMAGATLRDFETLLRSAGYPEQDIAQLTAEVTAIVPALPGLMVFSSLVGALLLGYWFWCLATEGKSFGAEFRELKLGTWLTALTAVIIGAALVFTSPLVQNLRLLGLTAAVFQGLAVFHSIAHARRWSSAPIALFYGVLLLLSPVLVWPLGIVGLVDNWVNWRARIRPIRE